MSLGFELEMKVWVLTVRSKAKFAYLYVEDVVRRVAIHPSLWYVCCRGIHRIRCRLRLDTVIT